MYRDLKIKLLCKVSQVVSKYSDGYILFHQGSASPSTDEKWTASNIFVDTDEIESDSIVQSYINTLFCSRLSSEKRPGNDDIKALFTGHSQDDTVLKASSAALETGMRRRRLAITSRRLLASAPELTEVGDLICICMAAVSQRMGSKLRTLYCGELPI